MPTEPMILVSAKNAMENYPARAVFRVSPKMTKHEIKEHLTKIYQLPVKKVNTMNYLGKYKAARGVNYVHYFKYDDFKKAIVTFDSSLQDIGLGTKIPELSKLT